jgi:IclR family transcriptional regulator, acetate operon repressor
VTSTQSPPRIRSVIKAVNLLTWLTCEPEPRTAKEAAVACGLPPATAYHLLDTLVAEGMLTKDARRCYHAGPRLGLIVDAYTRRSAQPEHLTAPLRRLAEITGETTYLSGFRDGDVTVLASVEGNQAVRVSGLHVGFRGFAHARASGKVLLAYAPPDLLERYLETPRETRTPNTIVEIEALRAELREIASAGYAFDRNEWVEGVSGVSAPVIEHGVAIAAYTVSAPTERFDARKDELVAAVLDAARAAVKRELI